MKKYSVTIAGCHNTSFSLEEEFYQELKHIAQQKNISINELITQIDAERSLPNLSSSIRVYILHFLKNAN